MLTRWKLTDPPEERCDFILTDGEQCGNKRASPEVTRCAMHGANAQQQSYDAKSKHMYQLAGYQKRVDELKEHHDVITLRTEIALARMLLEAKLKRVPEDQLALAAGPISEMLMKVEKLVASCHKLEHHMGGLLDLQKVKNIASQLMNCVATNVESLSLTDEQAQSFLEKVANDFLTALEKK